MNHASRTIAKHPFGKYYALQASRVIGISILLAACSLAEDITPPPGLELTQTAMAPAPSIPALQPNPAAGAEIYAQHCTKCHGPTGQGDGELVGQLNGQPPDFTDPATLRARAPHEIFTIVTLGRLEQTMPPFGNALTDEERWDVTAYLYTLAEPPTDTAEVLFTTLCAECHVNGNAPDLSALTFFATRTEQNVFDALTSGLPDRSHTFTALNDDERWALADYVHSLALAPRAGAQPGPLPTPAVTTPITEGVTVSGAVTNGTANAAVPEDVLVGLFVFDQTGIVGTYTTTVRGGRYALTSPALQVGQAFVASLTYQGVVYGSQVGRFAEGATQFDLPITIFETTTDSAVIRVARWHVVFAVQQAGAVLDTPAAFGGGQGVQVAELLVVSNNSDRALVAPGIGRPTLDILLPEGASHLQFEQGTERYQPTATGFGYVGAVLPGAETLSILFSFDLPLTGRKDFVQTLGYPVDALNVLAPQDGVRVTAPNLSGPQTTDVQGTPYLAYVGAALPANESLTLTLAPAGSASPAFDNEMVAAFTGAVLVGVGLFGTWFAWRTLSQRQRRRAATQTAPDPAQRRAALIDSLAQLDNDFARGQVAEGDYHRRRTKLKAEALALTQPRDRQGAPSAPPAAQPPDRG